MGWVFCRLFGFLIWSVGLVLFSLACFFWGGGGGMDGFLDGCWPDMID